jgi:hypothetical protein
MKKKNHRFHLQGKPGGWTLQKSARAGKAFSHNGAEKRFTGVVVDVADDWQRPRHQTDYDGTGRTSKCHRFSLI